MPPRFEQWPVPGHDGHYVRELSGLGLADVVQASGEVKAGDTDNSTAAVRLMAVVALHSYCDEDGVLLLASQDDALALPHRLLTAAAMESMQRNGLAQFDAAVEAERGN